MIKTKEAIVVEGRYDKNTLSQIVDATIFETNGHIAVLVISELNILTISVMVLSIS